MINQIKMSKGCMDCGYNLDPVALDFDHTGKGDKVSAIARLKTRAPIEKLMEEIGKCDVVCANCHRIRTRNRNPNGFGKRTF